MTVTGTGDHTKRTITDATRRTTDRAAARTTNDPALTRDVRHTTSELPLMNASCLTKNGGLLTKKDCPQDHRLMNDALRLMKNNLRTTRRDIPLTAEFGLPAMEADHQAVMTLENGLEHHQRRQLGVPCHQERGMLQAPLTPSDLKNRVTMIEAGNRYRVLTFIIRATGIRTR